MLMTMTTGRRLGYWKQTIASLKEVVHIEDLVDRCVIIDDQSSTVDLLDMRAIMDATFPKMDTEFVCNTGDTIYRHAESMRLWDAVVRKEPSGSFVFHCEDDWVFVERSYNPILWAMALLSEFDWIGQVCFQSWWHRAVQPTTYRGFWIPHAGNATWYLPSKFTFNPSVIRTDSVWRVADGFKDEDDFERGYGYQWSRGGYMTVHTTEDFCSHIGERSTYDINESIR